METKELIVTVKIMGRQFKIRSTADNEAAVRNAASHLDKLIAQFQKTYGSRDLVDPVIMAAISVGAELVRLKENMEYKDHQLINTLEDIDTVLDEYLHPSQNSL